MTSRQFLEWAAACETAGLEQFRTLATHELWLAKQSCPVQRLDAATPISAPSPNDRLRRASQMGGERVQRRLVAILAAAGYGRLTKQDKVGTLARFRAHRREAIDPGWLSITAASSRRRARAAGRVRQRRRRRALCGRRAERKG
jgi:hypothetical protein